MWDMNPKARKNFHKENRKRYFILCGAFLFLVLMLTLVIIVPLNEQFTQKIKIIMIIICSVMLAAIAVALAVKWRDVIYYKTINGKRFEAGYVIMSEKEKYATWELYISSLDGIRFNEIMLPQSKKFFDLSVKNYLYLCNNFSKIFKDTIKGKIYNKIVNSKNFKIQDFTKEEIENEIIKSRKIISIKGDDVRISFATDKLATYFVTEYKFNLKNIDGGISFESEY